MNALIGSYTSKVYTTKSPLNDRSKMRRNFTLFIAFFVVACIYEGVKILNEGYYNRYSFKLSHALLTPLFAIVAYPVILIISRTIVPASFNSNIFLLCAMILVTVAYFLAIVIIKAFPTCNLVLPFFPSTFFFWIFLPIYTCNSAGSSVSMSLQQYSLGDHFPRDAVGTIMVTILPPLAGLLTYRGLFLADSFLDRVFGWIIANCSVLFLSIILFSSVLVEMCKIEKGIIYLIWTRKRIFSTFLPSMIRNSVFQAFVYPGCLVTLMAIFDSSYFRLCFKLYCICFAFTFRNFPSFNWAPCLSGVPRKHTKGPLADWEVFELAVSNNYTWMLALVSTLAGCTICSFVFKVRFGTALFSLESLHAFIICRFLGTRIHAKAAIAQRETPVPCSCANLPEIFCGYNHSPQLSSCSSV